MNEAAVREALAIGLPPLLRQAHRRLLDELARGFLRHARSRSQAPDEQAVTGGPLRRLLRFLGHQLDQDLEEIDRLHGLFKEFARRHEGAVTALERRTHILDFARELGAGRRRLRGDRRALDRWLAYDAMAERYQRRVGLRERRITFCLGRIGVLTANLLDEAVADGNGAALFPSLRLEQRLRPLLSYPGDERVRIEAFRCLATALRALPPESHHDLVAEDSLQFIYRAALDRRLSVWTQGEALTLLAEVSPDSLVAAVEQRLARPGDGDDIFVRRRTVEILGAKLGHNPDLAGRLTRAAADPSPFVRQAVPASLRQADADRVIATLRPLVSDEPAAEVRAAALLALEHLVVREDLFEPLLDLMVSALERESDPFVARVALLQVAKAHRVLNDGDGETSAVRWRERLFPVLARLHRGAAVLPVRRWAAEARERLWCDVDPERVALHRDLAAAVEGVAEGTRRVLPGRLLRGRDEEVVGRILSVLAGDDHGLELEPGRWRPRLTRGSVFGFRSWRLLHELRHGATDKRQAHSHTIGRIAYGRLRAPSPRLAELAETKVPGEPVYVAEEDGWRPYLPLVDDAISCLDQGFPARPVRFFTSEGVTELTPPGSPFRRLWARTRLTTEFAHYARLRNWREQETFACDAYATALRALGFRVTFRAHPDEQGAGWDADPAVARFFPLVVPGLGGETWTRLQDYFFSVYQNSVHELGVFLAAVGGAFFVRHAALSRAIRRARRRLPLVIGGWGTRGKSGTERLKAAMLEAMGLAVVSKTTGCEAMFLHCRPYGRQRELALFRPYDKATIWEQANLVRLADSLGADVFLWECMGLTPAYVRILQRDWMQDDLSTITNTYPDHEDLQGPAGHDIPRVMTNFIPDNARLLTSEEQMRPILRDAARGTGSAFRAVGWLEAGLIPRDVLDRFPYAEHPYNIALVLALAEELGVAADFALKEMADRVVPDLGVLKAFPPAPIRGRVLEFVNGMSANERFGFFNNWRRMGFADSDPDREPDAWIITVVNNRADRVPRSKVFAEIIANEIGADRHILIGTNLHGLVGFIQRAWEAHAEGLSLWRSEEGGSLPDDFEREVRRLRVPTSTARVATRLEAMARGLGVSLDAAAIDRIRENPSSLSAVIPDGRADLIPDLTAHLARLWTEKSQYEDFRARVEGARSGQRRALDQEMRALLWQWLSARLVTVDDVHATGDAIIQHICRETPPGLYARVMGIQNIKGTGLDFAYRWQAWEACQRSCEALLSDQRAVAERALRDLAAFQDYGVVSEETVRAALEEVRHRPVAQTELFQAQVRVVEANLEAKLAEVRVGMEADHALGLLARVAGLLESFLDAGDAVRRRRQADRVYKDLVHERISHDRAVHELQAINSRQKGGWLLRRLETAFGLFRGRPGT